MQWRLSVSGTYPVSGEITRDNHRYFLILPLFRRQKLAKLIEAVLQRGYCQISQAFGINICIEAFAVFERKRHHLGQG